MNRLGGGCVVELSMPIVTRLWRIVVVVVRVSIVVEFEKCSTRIRDIGGLYIFKRGCVCEFVRPRTRRGENKRRVYTRPVR